ncbi:MAG: diguanylate cyclase [Betaproteobacteria bacterium]
MFPPEHLASPKASSLVAEKLRKRYIVALTLIALLTILSQLVVQFMISDQEHDSRVVNIAGRQRMLGQSITKTAFYIASAQTPESSRAYRQELDTLVTLWERSHRGLLDGDDELGLPGRNSPEIISLFAHIQPDHLAIVSAARHLLSAAERGAPIEQDIQTLRDHESAFQLGMNDIVFRYDLEAKRKVTFTSGLELFLMSLTLLVLTLEAMLIFAPITRRILHDMRIIEKKEEDQRSLFSVSPTALLLVDIGDLSIISANQKACDLIEETIETITRSNLRNYLDISHEENRNFLEKIVRLENLNDYEIVLLAAKHEVNNVLVSVRQISFSDREVFVLGLTNISELKKVQKDLEHFATFDEMTELINRRTGLLILKNSTLRSKRDGRQLTVCFADLDGLKKTNDRFGHAEGDWLLKNTARAMTESIRAGDIAIRLGGDEFLLIFNDCSSEEASRLLTRIEDSLSLFASEANKPYPAGISYGICTFDPARHTTQDKLIADADALMYTNKQEKKRLAGMG